jgi:hypothetical protein
MVLNRRDTHAQRAQNLMGQKSEKEIRAWTKPEPRKEQQGQTQETEGSLELTSPSI